jgi:hypothetical protein
MALSMLLYWIVITPRKNSMDCWACAISNWTGMDYEQIYKSIPKNYNGGANFRDYGKLVGSGARIPDDGNDGILQVKWLGPNGPGHVVLRVSGQILDCDCSDIDNLEQYTTRVFGERHTHIFRILENQ